MGAADRPRADPSGQEVSQLSIGEAAGRVSRAGERLVATHLQVLIADVQQHLWAGLGVMGAGVVALVGWLYLLEGVVGVLAKLYPPSRIQIAVGLTHLIVAAGGLWWSARRVDRRA